MRPQSLFKRFASSAFVGWAASALIGAYIRLVHATTRWEFIGREHVDAALAEGRGVILAFWHQRLLMGAAIRRETEARVFMLISAHRDGEIIANAVKPFGVEFIRGSAADPRKSFKNKGGAPAIAQMLAALSGGAIVGMTPDGPRGPRGRAQAGVLRLAELSGAAVVPAAYSASRGAFLGTWDRFLLAAPFSKGCFVAGAPIHVAAGGDAAAREQARAAIEAALTDAARLADASVGRSPDEAGLG